MIVRSLEGIDGTERDVQGPTWRSKRLVLARENVGFSLHETILAAGSTNKMWYVDHVEAVLCLSGEAELTNNETGVMYQITPGTMYLLDCHEHHTLRVISELRTICVFNPPCTGREVHDERGAYPLLRDTGVDTPSESRCDREMGPKSTPSL